MQNNEDISSYITSLIGILFVKPTQRNTQSCFYVCCFFIIIKLVIKKMNYERCVLKSMSAIYYLSSTSYHLSLIIIVDQIYRQHVSTERPIYERNRIRG